MYQRILLATDLSEGCKSIAKKASELANHFDAKLYLVHVIEPIPAYGYPGVTEIKSPYIDEAKKSLGQLGSDLLVPEENQIILVGPTKKEILKKAKELEIDLIVVGSHGRHGLAHLLGSTANAILHGAECDVVTVRANAG